MPPAASIDWSLLPRRHPMVPYSYVVRQSFSLYIIQLIANKVLILMGYILFVTLNHWCNVCQWRRKKLHQKMAIFRGDSLVAATRATVIDWGRAGLSGKLLLAPIRRQHAGDDQPDHHGFDGPCHRSIRPLCPLCFFFGPEQTAC